MHNAYKIPLTNPSLKLIKTTYTLQNKSNSKQKGGNISKPNKEINIKLSQICERNRKSKEEMRRAKEAH